jgi:hypothetical protein
MACTINTPPISAGEHLISFHMQGEKKAAENALKTFDKDQSLVILSLNDDENDGTQAINCLTAVQEVLTSLRLGRDNRMI